ncbi:hypothetical protein GI374_03235 [Paracoccus sp. S-4012]|uniref:hypothetical protein n=1 Tax=Paracoccus sp. S-4012 TaxID=2665648 RepID=UPI0012AF4905|nr:hypothetical protein [Paracoccus sp. S-4012]MRX49475.1 hypothetical protein [Paracoccus sp. S-4012]
MIYLPFLQPDFSTTALSAGGWLFCTAVPSLVLRERELSKVATRREGGGWMKTRLRNEG